MLTFITLSSIVFDRKYLDGAASYNSDRANTANLSLELCSLFQRSNELPSTSSSETQGPSPDKLCDLDDEICLTDHPDYPLTQIRQGLTRHGTLDDKKAFSSLVSLAGDNTIAGWSFNSQN